MKSIYSSNITELKIRECGREICVPNKAIVLSRKSYHLFHYVVAGKGTFEIAGHIHHLSEGSLFYIPPNSDAKYSPDKGDPWTYEWLGIEGIAADDFIQKTNLSEGNPVIRDNNDLNLKRYFDMIINDYARYGIYDVYMVGVAIAMFGMLLRQAGFHKTDYTATESHVEKAKEFIKNNYQFDIKVTDVAKNVGVSPNYLANIFTESNQISPKQYLKKIRLETAKQMILTNRYKIKDIAIMVGYKNQLHLSAEFKKYFGVSPSMIKGEE